MTGKPIFFDPTGRRGRLLIRLAWAMGALSGVILTLFIASLIIVNHPATAGSLEPHTSIRCAWAPTCSAAHSLTVTSAADPAALRNATRLAEELREDERKLRVRRPQAGEFERRSVPASLTVPEDRAVSIGFYASWDDNSYPALKRALPHLDWIIPSWLSLSGRDMSLKASVDDRVLSTVQATKPNVAILPMIQNVAAGEWDGKGLAKFLADPTARAARIAEIVDFVGKYKFQGVTVDFEEVPPGAQKNLEAFLTELNVAFAAHDYAIVLSVPFDDDSWPYATYADLVDFMLLMAYDQHWAEGHPGSIAGQSWFEEKLDERMQSLDPAHTIIALGAYGYDWVKGQKTAELTFEEAVLSAKDSEADIMFDPETSNPHFSFIEDDGKRPDVWFLDGVTAFNEIHAADAYRPAGYALWRLGSEDPSVVRYGAQPPEALHRIGMSQDIDFEGQGELLHIGDEPAKGKPNFEIDGDTGLIVDENYKTVPTPFVIQRSGALSGKVALTFDDGPDPD
jgi:peptidoglycan-N-acetylglucosamine deacetylase